MNRLLCLSAALSLVAASAAFAEDLTPAQQESKAQLAAHLGVNADDYTLSELAQLSCRIEAASSDAEKRRLLEEPLSREPAPASASSEGQAQLAASLGVDADDFTANELALLKTLSEDDSCNVGDPASYAHAGERVTMESARAKVQLATAMGVDPSDYTLSDLLKMRFGKNEDD